MAPRIPLGFENVEVPYCGGCHIWGEPHVDTRPDWLDHLDDATSQDGSSTSAGSDSSGDTITQESYLDSLILSQMARQQECDLDVEEVEEVRTEEEWRGDNPLNAQTSAKLWRRPPHLPSQPQFALEPHTLSPPGSLPFHCFFFHNPLLS